MYTNPAIVDGVWPKKINVKVGNGKKQHEIKMAYDDREIAKASRRVFENANPFTIPNNVYTFVILENGVTSFGNPVDSTELGTRHAHLSQGRGVVASGELVKSNAGIRLNFLSGTYMLPLLDQGKHDPVKLRDGIFQWFDKVLRAKYKGPASFKIAFNLKGKPSKDNSWGNEAIFEITKNGGDRLPPPTFCELQTEIHACDAKYGFAKRNVEFCELVNAPKCGK